MRFRFRSNRSPASLYISYDGMLEPLGQSQVLAYLERLAAGRLVYLLSFEKSEDWMDVRARDRLQTRIRAAGIHWIPRRYHKRPSALATAWDVFVGIVVGLALVLRNDMRFTHCRSDVPALVGLALKYLTGTKLLFDMRGYWADERVDGGLWKSGSKLHRTALWFERKFLQKSDEVVVLTQAVAREIPTIDWMRGTPSTITVIPTCADLKRFAPAGERKTKSHLTVGYVGSASTWYQFDAVMKCFRMLLDIDPTVRFLVINRGEHDFIKKQASLAGVPPEALEVRAAQHAEVPDQVRRMDAAIFFYRVCHSRIACAPTKFAELLGCGIPCMVNVGIGDMSTIVEREQVGVAVDGFEQEVLKAGLLRFLDLVRDPEAAERCRASALRHFSLDQGVTEYARIYDRLSGVSEGGTSWSDLSARRSAIEGDRKAP